ncbi:MAG: glycosyltransferase family 39 protein, partial [Rhodoferax sp.]|nr:glycosyltransferase family 39 protein [Rhodoferax sp.]
MTEQTLPTSRPGHAPSALGAWVLLAAIFAAVQFASLFSPPLLDDADASHAEAAQHMALSGDWVTLKVNGIRYLEKPPLPYWLDAGLYKVFGDNVFATHLPNALALLGCAWIAWLWASRAWGRRAAFYSALGVLTSIGPFLFTRFAIPEALLSFLFLLALYCFLSGMESHLPVRFYVMWVALALATL